MMFWYGHDISGWGWFIMSVGTILFWALIIAGAVLLFHALGRSREQSHTHAPAGPMPEQILADRFARGEIDKEEYHRRLAALHPPTTPRFTKS